MTFREHYCSRGLCPRIWHGYRNIPSFERYPSTLHHGSSERSPTCFSDRCLKIIMCGALDEARNSGGFLIFAYVIMPEHIHLLTDQPTTSAELLRYVKGITARRVIDYLKGKNYQSSLKKLQHVEWKREHRHSLWQQEKNVLSIFSENVFMQKVNYIHLNPVRAGLVDRATDYRWSSA
jgi:REP element-mobilizing transposase RayT